MPNKYERVAIESNKKLVAWYYNSGTKGTFILFHGYAGEKSDLLQRANLLEDQGYSTLLVDFMGHGDSEGFQTTIGFQEAKQVQSCYEFIQKKGESTIYLFGASMGAVAIMKAIDDELVFPNALILECPFGSLLKTVKARFDEMHVPTFPMAHLLVFWGGLQNAYWGFAHKPSEYAKSIDCPVLLLQGGKDTKISLEETQTIFENLHGEKTLHIYDEARHEDYLLKYRKEWVQHVYDFLESQ